MLQSMTQEALTQLRLHGTSELAQAAHAELKRRKEALQPAATKPEQPGAAPEDFAS
jgi:hypothetical protein